MGLPLHAIRLTPYPLLPTAALPLQPGIDRQGVDQGGGSLSPADYMSRVISFTISFYDTQSPGKGCSSFGGWGQLGCILIWYLVNAFYPGKVFYIQETQH